MNSINIKKLKGNLPKHPGVLGKEEYFNSAVLIAIIKINGKDNFLFEKRAVNIRQGSEICFPGGEIDLKTDATFIDTALRETKEELGIPKNKIEIIGSMNTLVGPMGVTVDPVIGLLNINSVEEINYDEKEVGKVFALPIDFFFKQKPEEFKLKMEIQPSYINEEGENIILLPAEELELPVRYSKPWKAKVHTVLAYRTEFGTIWGITAKLIYEFIKLI
jgi:8-oxo-dGTP pyrophosphatase MutT (NUDIX family)